MWGRGCNDFPRLLMRIEKAKKGRAATEDAAQRDGCPCFFPVFRGFSSPLRFLLALLCNSPSFSALVCFADVVASTTPTITPPSNAHCTRLYCVVLFISPLFSFFTLSLNNSLSYVYSNYICVCAKCARVHSRFYDVVNVDDSCTIFLLLFVSPFFESLWNYILP
jgi:hypothetical protein